MRRGLKSHGQSFQETEDHFPTQIPSCADEGTFIASRRHLHRHTKVSALENAIISGIVVNTK